MVASGQRLLVRPDAFGPASSLSQRLRSNPRLRWVPQWRNNPEAKKEEFACLKERRAARAREKEGISPQGWVAFL